MISRDERKEEEKFAIETIENGKRQSCSNEGNVLELIGNVLKEQVERTRADQTVAPVFYYSTRRVVAK